VIYFDHNSGRYHLRHHNNDDSRTVVECEDFNFNILLKFDSDLNIFGPSGLMLGRLRVDYKIDQWTLLKADGEIVRLDVPILTGSMYNWQEILKAEVEAAKILLS
jgi:hypothetical protein